MAQHRVQVEGFRVEGIAPTPEQVIIVLKSGATVKATVTTWPNNDLRYWVNLPALIQPNDTVEVTAGGNTAVIPVTPLAATLDYQNDALDVSGLPANATFTAELTQPGFGQYLTTTVANGAGMAHITVFGEYWGGILTPDWQADAYGIVRYTHSTGHQVFRTLKSVTVYERGNRVDLTTGLSNTPFTVTVQTGAAHIVCPRMNGQGSHVALWFYDFSSYMGSYMGCSTWEMPYNDYGYPPVPIAAGSTVTVEWDGAVTTIPIQPQLTVNTDVNADTISGVGQPGTTHRVWAHGVYTDVMADGLGAYTAGNPFRSPAYDNSLYPQTIDLQIGDTGKVCTGIAAGAQLCANYAAADVTVAIDAGLREGNLAVIGRALPGVQVEIWDITPEPDVRLDNGDCYADSNPTNARFTCAVTPPLIYNHAIIAVANGYSSALRWVGRALTINGPATSNSTTVNVHGIAPANASVTVQESGVTLANTSADSSGHWDTSVTLTNGAHTLSATSGGATSDPINVTVDAAAVAIGPSTVIVDGTTHVADPSGANAFIMFVIPPVSPVQVDVKIYNNMCQNPVHLTFLNQTLAATYSGDNTWRATFTDYPMDGGAQPIMAQVADCNTGVSISQEIAEPFLLIDPSGEIYDSLTNQRLPNATVTLYEWNGSAWQLWAAGLYGQINPQPSDAQGRYGFMVPPGDYQVEASHSGYTTVVSGTYHIPPEVTDAHIGLTPLTGQNLLSIVLFAGDQPLTSTHTFAPLYAETLDSLTQSSVGHPEKTLVLVGDFPGDGDTHIRVIQNGGSTLIHGLPNAQGTLDANLHEYDMTDGATLGGFLTWARQTYGAGAQVTLSYIGHGAPVMPQVDLSNFTFNQMRGPQSNLFPMPIKLGGHSGFTDWTPRRAVISARALGQALALSTSNGQSPIQVLDLIVCSQLTLEALTEVYSYTETTIGSPNYTYFDPTMPGAVVSALTPGLTATQMATTFVQTYDSIIRAADDPATTADDHPSLLVAVDSSKVAGIVAAWQSVSHYLMEAFTQNYSDTRANLLAAYSAAPKYDTCGTPWACEAPDAVVDLRFGDTLSSAFGPMSPVGIWATTARIRAEAALIARATTPGVAWFTEPESPPWDFSTNVGIGLFAPFQAMTFPGDANLYLPWQAHWYTGSHFNFTAATLWDAVIAKFWENDSVQTHFCLPTLPVVLREGELKVESMIFPLVGTVSRNTPVQTGAVLSTTRILNTQVRFTVYVNGAAVFSDTVATGYRSAGMHPIYAARLWTPTITGVYTMVVDVDADNRIRESDEMNNRFTTAPDIIWPTATRPVISAEVVGNRQFITTPDVPLNVTQIAGLAPIQQMTIQIYGYIPGVDPQTQVSVLLDTQVFPNLVLPLSNFILTLPASVTPGPLELHVWGWSADGLTVAPVMLKLNYAPATSITAGGDHYFRFTATAGESWQFDLNVTNGDANLFAWDPYNIGSPTWNATAVGSDSLSFTASLAGQYILNVHGETPADYTLSATRNGVPGLRRSGSTAAVNHSQAFIPTARPAFVAPIPNIPEIIQSKVKIFLPLVSRNH